MRIEGKHSPNWGGNRGGHRPKSDKVGMMIKVRLSEENAQKLRNLGGAKWVNPILERELAKISTTGNDKGGNGQ